MASVILIIDQQLSEFELRQFLVVRLSHNKVPRYIEYVNEYPLNASGKVLKDKLKEEAIVRIKNASKNRR